MRELRFARGLIARHLLNLTATPLELFTDFYQRTLGSGTAVGTGAEEAKYHILQFLPSFFNDCCI
jgi:hypothetical protein